LLLVGPKPFRDEVLRGGRQRVSSSFVTVREPEFDFQHASDDGFVLQPPDEDGEAMHYPDGAGIGVPDPGERGTLYKVLA
jgi:hypothetical protein